ncbi:MATE family efflux transporter [Endomicrobium proavitum]|uniref:Putative O-antigen export protein n=1 Tax=Endomicrobium proavitum TaxID=1408281 RepID=A0A0G3WJN0_9BACT|nr:MATE family efflux transporter [Endomicrobium proavitum]AKL97704.1 putative O-antigen export protein [Endomicrobium proavitum]
MITTIKNFFKQIPRHLLVTASAWTSKIIVSLVQIISIRTLLSYLGEERYAAYIIAYSLTAWFVLADFGVGISLQNFISECRAKKESYDKYLLAALQIAAVLFIVAAALIIFLAFPVQDILFRKFSSIDGIGSMPLVLIVGIVTLVNVLSNFVFRVYFAEHKGYIPNIIPAISAICSMAAIFFLNRYSPVRQDIITALIIFTLPNLIFTLIPFIKIFKKFFTQIFHKNTDAIKSLIIRSAKFQGIAVIGVAYAQADYIVMSQTLQAEAIITYSIFMRVFMFFSFIYSSLLIASWPMFSEMYVEKKYNELKTQMKKYLTYVTLFIITGTVAILSASGLIVQLLAPNTDIAPATTLILLLGAYVLVKSWTDTFSSMLQSFNALRIFWIYMPFQTIINFAMQYFMSKKYGAQGIVIGLIASLVLTALWILPLKFKKTLRGSHD